MYLDLKKNCMEMSKKQGKAKKARRVTSIYILCSIINVIDMLTWWQQILWMVTSIHTRTLLTFVVWKPQSEVYYMSRPAESDICLLIYSSSV